MLHFFSITVFWSLIESIFLKTEHFTVHTKDKIEKDKAECDVKNKKTQQSAKVYLLRRSLPLGGRREAIFYSFPRWNASHPHSECCSSLMIASYSCACNPSLSSYRIENAVCFTLSSKANVWESYKRTEECIAEFVYISHNLNVLLLSTVFVSDITGVQHTQYNLEVVPPNHVFLLFEDHQWR